MGLRENVLSARRAATRTRRHDIASAPRVRMTLSLRSSLMSSKPLPDVIAVIEAAYRLDLDDKEFRQLGCGCRVTSSARPPGDAGMRERQ